MRTHAAMPPSGGRHGVDPLHPGWRPDHPPAAPPGPLGPLGPADHARPSGYGPAPEPAGYQPAPPPAHPHGQPHAYWQDHDGVSVEDRRWADLRNQVAYRSKRLNTGHMIEADQRFGHRDALGPHGLMLFFVTDARAEPHGYKLHTAYRLWLASPEADNLPRLLTDLTSVAAGNITRATSAGHRWSPLGPEGSMVNGGDMSMPADATYVGIGISTLDSDQGRWFQVARMLRDAPPTGRRLSAFDLKGQCYALLTDGTALHIDRDPHARLGDDGIRCTKTLNPDRITYHNPHANLTEQGDDATRAVWRLLAALHHTLTTHLLAGRPA